MQRSKGETSDGFGVFGFLLDDESGDGRSTVRLMKNNAHHTRHTTSSSRTATDNQLQSRRPKIAQGLHHHQSRTSRRIIRCVSFRQVLDPVVWNMNLFVPKRRSQVVVLSLFIAIGNMRHFFAAAFVRGELWTVKPQHQNDASALRLTKNLWSIEDCLDQIDNIQFIDASWYHKGERNGRQE